ncbi:MAG: acetyl-CoA synthase subunit gamma [Deltaproteobacteria bacterium]|nr:acetyl-CoA synthase subunit gamma [Deltaproteobacteria bacterium]
MPSIDAYSQRTLRSFTVRRRVDAPWIDGFVVTASGKVPRVQTALDFRDCLGSVKARWDIGRMNYRVPPGLYAAGNPGIGSTVLVSANYKMSFDRLRSVLPGRDAWILVLDTDGVNVWCSAGKGTFGTDEIVRRVQESGLERVVSHRTLVVPQLGAPGVSAHEVQRRCGFRVEYGPVQAEDLPAFLDSGMKASPDMRRVRFRLRDRAVLIPVELVMGAKYAVLLALAFLLLGGVSGGGYSLAGVRTIGLKSAAVVLGAFLAGAVLGPILLPWLPGRAFSAKGAALGLVLVAGIGAWDIFRNGGVASWLHAAAWMAITPALTSFVVMNFTGASTFTSLSGVRREMRFALPLQVAAAAIGFGFWLGGLFAA